METETEEVLSVGPRPLEGEVVIACLNGMTEARVRSLVGDDTPAARISVSTLDREASPAEVDDLLRRADLLIAGGGARVRLDRRALTLMERCRLIQQPSVGFDQIDHRAAAALGIPVANCAGYNRDSVADWVILGILSVIRYGAQGDRIIRGGGWGAAATGRELGAMTVGIVGLGNVGNAVATRLRAFGSPILYHDIAPRSLPGARPVSLDELLRSSDVVTVHVPLDDETRGLIGHREFAAMREGSVFVNASRGPVVDEAALIETLQNGHLRAAALDVFEYEPLPADSPLRELDNVFLTSHIGGNTEECRARALDFVGTNLRRVIAGQEPFNVVNGVGFRR
ncbi:MAG: 2-hydroxyacid dehydrogenase [Candidatus Dormibacteraeota bacterium]|nr:2-hydroxyacid dehydrogenase [Candidatus Dormibacteraeota bacterium]